MISQDFDDGLRIFAGVWCFINSFAGTAGNLLTLVAIPYAMKRKMFGFGRSDAIDIITPYVLNLAFADFLYCTTSMPVK